MYLSIVFNVMFSVIKSCLVLYGMIRISGTRPEFFEMSVIFRERRHGF